MEPSIISVSTVLRRLSGQPITLFGFMNNLSSHLVKNPSIHSYHYEFSGFFTTCLARLPIIPKSLMNCSGRGARQNV